MKQDVEKLLLWFIPIFIISAVVQLYIQQYPASVMGMPEGTTTILASEMSWLEKRFTKGQLISYAHYLSVACNVSINILIAAWLFLTSPKYGFNKWLFLFFGLFAKYWALITFFCILFYENTANKNSHTD